MKIACILFIFLLVVSSGFCTEDTKTEMQDTLQSTSESKDTIIIAIRNDMPPLSFLNVEEHPSGFLADMWRLWAEKTGTKIEFRAAEWKETLESLKNGTSDIIGAISYTEERARLMAFSQHFYELGMCVFYLKNQENFHSITDLKGVKTGITGGTILEKQMREHYSEIDLVTFTAIKDMIHAAMNRKIRAFVSTPASVMVILQHLGLAGDFESTDETLFPIQTHASVLKKNTKLLALVNKGLDAISNKELAEIESRWVPDPAKRYYRTSDLIRLTRAEEIWIKNNKTARVSMPVVFPPMMYVEEDNSFHGMIPDYIRLISNRTGIRFDMVSALLSELPERIRTRQIDLFPIFMNLQPDQYISFTDPFFSVAWVIVNRTKDSFVRNVKDLEGMKVSVVNNIPLYQRILNDYPEIKVHTVENPTDGMQAVASGKSDAFIGALPVVGYLIRKYHIANLKIAGSAGYEDYLFRFAVRSDLPELTDILNKAIHAVSVREHDDIFKNNMPVRFEYAADWREIIKWICLLSVFFSIIIIMGIISNRQLTREIAQRRKTEAALQKNMTMLQESEKKFRFAFENANIGMCLVNPAGHITRVNSQMCKIFGYTRDELENMTVNDIAYPEDTTISPRFVKRALSGEIEHSQFEKRYVHKQGHIVWGEVSSSLVRDSQGAPLYFISHLQNVTDRKRAENALRESEANLKALIENTDSSIWAIDTNYCLIIGNPVFHRNICEAFGQKIARGESVFLNHIPPDAIEEWRAYYDRALHGERFSIEQKRKFVVQEHWMEYRFSPIPAADNRILGVTVTGRDITDRKQAENALKEYSERLEEMVEARTQELKKAQDELLLKERLAVLGHFAGNISHEIRNPLAVIDSSVYFLDMKLGAGDEKTRQHLRRITANVKKTTAIIESLLSLTRMEKPKTESCVLTDVIFQSLNSLEIPETMKVITDFPDQPVSIRADAEQIRMAFKNIIRNAVQAADNTGKLTVAVRALETGEAEITVADTGPGIPPEILGKIFLPLFTTKAQGIGFGLSITRMIIENHGGTVRAESEPGSGAVFIVTLKG